MMDKTRLLAENGDFPEDFFLMNTSKASSMVTLDGIGSQIKLEEVSTQTYKILKNAMTIFLETENVYDGEISGDKTESWRKKQPENWSADDVMDWIYDQANIHQADFASLRGENFQLVDGQKLCRMTKTDFEARDELFGPVLYKCLQEILSVSSLYSKGAHSNAPGPIWQQVHPTQWTCEDVLDWIYYGSGFHDINLSCLKGENFQGVDGRNLCNMRVTDFEQRDPELGLMLYNSLQCYLGKPFDPESTRSVPDVISLFSEDLKPFKSIRCFDPSTSRLTDETVSRMTAASAGATNNLQREQQPSPLPPSRLKSKRPRKSRTSRNSYASEDDLDEPSSKMPKQSSKTRLWKFMRDLLDNPKYNPECIRWENKDEGIFRIIAGRSKDIAELWGKIKNNPTMTFDKLGRSLRWCRANNGKFSAVPRDGKFPRKLCFRLADLDQDEEESRPTIKSPTAASKTETTDSNSSRRSSRH